MRLKLKGRKILNGEMISPDMIIGQFNNELNIGSIKNIIEIYNFGLEMLSICRYQLTDLSIRNVVKIIDNIHSERVKLETKMLKNKHGK